MFKLLGSYIFWAYERGSVQYDIMVTAILLFMFVSPHIIDYKDKPVETVALHSSEVLVREAGTSHGSSRFIYQVRAEDMGHANTDADFRWDLYELVVKETTTQTGTIYFKKQGTTTVMGARVVSPSIKIIEFRNGVVRLFEPNTNHLTIIDATKNKAQFESFLTVGFGGSGTDLAKAWTISDLGDETIDGIKTAKLDLVAKDPAVRNNCTHMTIR